MQEHRERQPRIILIAGREISRRVEFAQVEFLPVAHAVVALAGAHGAEHDEVDAVGLDRSVGERADEVIAAGREVRYAALK